MIIAILFSIIQLFGCHSHHKTSQPKTASNWTQVCEDWDLWDKAGPPFHIYGNSYYVGTCGISSILITGNQGHILIDSGTKNGADVVLNNIKSLGFAIEDVKLLLHSHEHHDHVGGLARLKQHTGARLLASPSATKVLNTGIASDDDPQAGMSAPFTAVAVDQVIDSDQSIHLGHLSLTPIATPGHTPGALSWQWQSCEKGQCLSIVYADSLSPISRDDYFFSEHPTYLKAYKDGLTKLRVLECDLILAPHPSASKMRDRLISTNGLIDQQGCQKYADGVLERLNNRLIKEQKNQKQ